MIKFLDLKGVNLPYIEALHQAASRVIDSGRYIGGDEVERLEEAMCQLTGARFAIGVANGLDALRLILMGYVQLGRLQPGDEVIVPANSFIASALAVSQAGLTPRMADVDPLTMNLDWKQLPLSPKVKAIMPVHLYGRVCDIPEEYLQRYIIIEDAAQCIGAQMGRGHAAGFSFYPTKNVGALGDGGCVTTSDPDLAAVIRSLHNYGQGEHYHNLYQGINSRLDPLQAALLSTKLPFTHQANQARRDIAAIYDCEISNPLIIKPQVVDNHVWHQYVVQAPEGRREELRAFLLAGGVETGVHYPIAIHRQPCYAEMASLSLPQAERLCATVVSLPIAATTPAEAHQVAQILNTWK